MNQNIPFSSELYTSTSHKVSASPRSFNPHFLIRTNRPLIGLSHVIVVCPDGSPPPVWVKHTPTEAVSHPMGFCENTSMAKSWSLSAEINKYKIKTSRNIIYIIRDF